MAVGGILVEAEPSDTLVLIESCLRRVREHAKLDADPVLPPLHVLVGAPAPPPATALARTAAAPPRADRRSAPTAKITARTRRPRRTGWPVLLCGFIAGVFGGAAAMKSPIGQRPEVRSTVTAAQGDIARAWTVASGAVKARLPHR